MPCNKTAFVCVFAAAAAFFFILSVLFCAAAIKKSMMLKKFRRENALFLSSAAHDLKSPLTNIKGYADAMLSNELTGAEKDTALAVISFEAERLSKIAGRLCDGFGSENRRRLSMSVFGICDTLHYIGSLLEKKAGQRDIEIVYFLPDEEEIYVFADKDAIIEALYNLFDNAVKYCMDGGKIKVYADSDFEKRHCIISVCNPAYAVYGAETESSAYFKPGFRGKPYVAQTQAQGHGLGLYIARGLINAHGKELTLSVKPQTERPYEQNFDITRGKMGRDKEKELNTENRATETFSFSFSLDLAPDNTDGSCR